MNLNDDFEFIELIFSYFLSDLSHLAILHSQNWPGRVNKVWQLIAHVREVVTAFINEEAHELIIFIWMVCSVLVAEIFGLNAKIAHK